jgi:hypothetical protein
MINPPDNNVSARTKVAEWQIGLITAAAETAAKIKYHFLDLR